MELLWHLLNLGNGWSSSVMRLTYKTLINIMVRWREGREWRDETREWQKRRNGGPVRETGKGEERERKGERGREKSEKRRRRK